MDKTVTAVIGGKERVLNYSIEVMFDMAEKYGTITNALELIERNDIRGFEAVRWFAVHMANDGEICRRAEGYDASPMVTEKDITAQLRPIDFEELRGAVVDAITLGYRREIEEESGETDLGLAELRAKKAKAGE